MKSGGGCPLLLLSFVGLLFFVAQLPGTSGHNVTEKAGTCPPQTETATTSGNCTEECQSDAYCEENQKCCPAGCGTSCRVPDDKPGSCPKFTGGISSLGFCMDKCMKDSDCEDDTKCCRNGCGKRSCLTPDL